MYEPLILLCREIENTTECGVLAYHRFVSLADLITQEKLVAAESYKNELENRRNPFRPYWKKETIEAFIVDWRNGDSDRELCIKYGLHDPHVVHLAKKRYGAGKRKNIKQLRIERTDIQDCALRMFDCGNFTLEEICYKMDISIPMLLKMLKIRDVVVDRITGKRIREWKDDEIFAIQELLSQGCSVDELIGQFSCTAADIEKLSKTARGLKEHGLDHRTKQTRHRISLRYFSKEKITHGYSYVRNLIPPK